MSANNEIVKIVIGEDFRADRAIKKFKRMCDMYGVTKEYKARKHHKKPSIARKEKSEQAEKRRKKLERKMGQRRRRRI